MVLKKRQYYGFNGFNFPFVPRAPRSARGRVVHKKKVEDSQLCPFELLASLAGKLLQESESSSASSNASEAANDPAISDGVIKLEQFEDKPVKTECLDQASCEGSTFVAEVVSPDGDRKCLLKESPPAGNNSTLEHSSMLTNSDSSVKVSSPIKSAICKGKSTTESFSGKVEGGLPDSGDSSEGSLENGLSRQPGEGVLESGGLTVNNTCSSNAPLEPFVKFPAMINSGNHVELPFCRDAVPNASVLGHGNNVKLGIRDDDENFSRCNKLNIKPKAFRPPPRIGDRRIRKLLTSKYWKLAPKLKDCELPKVGFLDEGAKPLYRKRKICYSRDRYQCETLYKRRKFSDPSLVVTSDGGFSSESVCNSPEKGVMRDKNGSTAISHGANGVSSSLMSHQASFHPKGSHVKFSINSFKIPELFIEVPENATVGSLKRTVMETVTAILGDGLRVGVLLHGKKVRDDNRTLLQTGITSAENLDTLGFTLEPTPAQAPAPVCAEDPPALLPCNQSQTLSRSPATPISDPGTVDALPDPPPLANLSNNNNIESNHESGSTPTDMLTDNSHSDSKALVPVPVPAPPVKAEALAVVPVNQKSRRPELVQRRTRRPFSVAEVEALVQAVEELGTGRWRDVKLRSFENADHRTYVDLKDKWKTLVHTAKIAPQQRRGEPVPQELLDRVLAAHAYWSQHQAKQHGKNQTVALKVAETQAS